MPPPPHTKPENVLKRAQELIGVGQTQTALALLHEHVTSKRTRSVPIASLEPVMILFVELCVDLRKGKSAKDGLYSYKNTAQNANVGTIELVLKHFIELAEKKVVEAQAKADEVSSSADKGEATDNIDDLEATETPESILLSTVSGEQDRDRTDRAIVTPWLKFLWETYRTVLEILKNNARLELLYQSTAHQAFQFCLKYTRKTEFRRLCELLRNHLQTAAKYQAQAHQNYAINLSDSDTLQRHLDTRFHQLNVAAELELWQEAFKSVEDIHYLLSLSKRQAKPLMLSNYFEKLSKIFLVSENYLFHAAAYNKYFNMLRMSAAALASGQASKKDHPSVTEAELADHASFVILSALAIPVISTTRSRGALDDVDETRKNKNQRLTNLLSLSVPPTRASLFKDITSKGLLKKARPEIRQLYEILEVDFHPLSICKKISPILSRIGADAQMGKYVLPLQQVILTRLFQQLSQVYESVNLSFVLGLAQFPEPFQVSSATVEKFIMNGCKKGDLAIRIDHATGVLTFDSDVFSSARALHHSVGAENETSSVQQLQSTPAEIVRSQLARLGKALYITCQYVDPMFLEDQRKARDEALKLAETGAEKEHLETLDRRTIIERKKQAAASAAAIKDQEEQKKKRQRQQDALAAENLRRVEEQKKKEQQRIVEEQNKIRRADVSKQLEELKQQMPGIDVSDLTIDDLDTAQIRLIKLKAIDQKNAELKDRLRVTARRIDHLERAFRVEEVRQLPADYQAQRQRDLEEHKRYEEQTLEESREKFDKDLKMKQRLTRLVPHYEEYRDTVRTQRHAEFERRRRTAARELEQKKQARIEEFKARKVRELRERETREQAEREEAERIEREAAERATAEEERKRKAAEERARREEDRRRLDEVAEQQRRREEEATARRTARTQGATVDTNPSARPEAKAPPVIAQKSGGWREREAQRQAAAAAGETSSTSPAPVAAAPTSSPPPVESDAPVRRGYIPPALRNTSASGSQSRGDSMPEGWRGSSRDSGSRPTAGRPAPGRDALPDRTTSPANGVVPGRSMERSFSGRGDGDGSQGDSPAPPQTSSGPQRYRPGAFRQRNQQ